MQTEAFVQIEALFHVVVASLATSFVAVKQSKWRPVVSRRNDSIVLRDDGPVSLFHAVASGCSQLGQLHEVGVESWSNQFHVVEVKAVQLTEES